MMKGLKISLLLGLLSVVTLNRAQDFHLSMYDAAPLFLNPAMTGVVDADWRVHGQYRTQWKSVNFKPYTTGLVSFDMPYKKWGFGGQIMNYRAGVGNYNAFQALVSAGYTVPLTENKAHNLSFGVQGGVTQKSVEIPLHTFNNQYVTSGGGDFDNTINSGENFERRALTQPNVNAGILYYYAKQQSKFNPFIGVSAFNLIEPKETFILADSKLPLRLYVHAGTRINITEKLYLIPKLLLMQQHVFSEMTLSAEAGYYLETADLYALAGLIYRNKDAVVITAGAKKENFIFKIGYDFNVSTLTSNSTGRGGFEISFTYVKKKHEPKTVKICPRL